LHMPFTLCSLSSVALIPASVSHVAYTFIMLIKKALRANPTAFD